MLRKPSVAGGCSIWSRRRPSFFRSFRSGHRTRLLEIGTSSGYSTLWRADAALATGGQVTSVDRSAEKQAMAEANLTRAGLRGAVTLLGGDALSVAAGLEGAYDFVFLDADRLQYPALPPLLLPRLLPGALVLADNAHSHPQEIAGYLESLAAGRALTLSL